MHIFIHQLPFLYSGAVIPDYQTCLNFSGHQLCVSRWRQIEVKNPIERHERFIGSRGVRRSQWRLQCHRQGTLTLTKINFFSLRGKERKKTWIQFSSFLCFSQPLIAKGFLVFIDVYQNRKQVSLAMNHINCSRPFESFLCILKSPGQQDETSPIRTMNFW